ncbi:hypothetical protein ABH930_006765 [Kitasatospora sp. GAS204A]|uniref:hypothetical protein n=1 Tax=unclassified Kitasatospora TaxID=2633591 RepID=UPI002474398E|nr:hypothetical protein [Kitasatospora sp. GAS204B]MDH6122489.1 hypothetical protein [Kitasatospora sp. GAS204B]
MVSGETRFAAAYEPVAVELTGITEPATFARVPDALAAAWESVKVLPLSRFERIWLECMLTSPDAELLAVEGFKRDGGRALLFRFAGSMHQVRIRPADLDARTAAQLG